MRGRIGLWRYSTIRWRERLDLGAPEVRDLVALLAKRHIIVQSSFCVYEAIGRRGDSATSAGVTNKFKAFGRQLHAAGVPIVVGTDNACPIAHEFEILRDIGYSNGELLHIATVDAARVMGRDADVGVIASGMKADILVCDGDPLSAIADVARLSSVMKAGVLYDDLARLRMPLPFLPADRGDFRHLKKR